MNRKLQSKLVKALRTIEHDSVEMMFTLANDLMAFMTGEGIYISDSFDEQIEAFLAAASQVSQENTSEENEQ